MITFTSIYFNRKISFLITLSPHGEYLKIFLSPRRERVGEGDNFTPTFILPPQGGGSKR
jgi:hypothetical protein